MMLRPARGGEWQTRRTQKSLLFGACGFKSRPGHPAPFAVDQSSDRPRSADQLHAGPVALDVDRCYVRAGHVDAEELRDGRQEDRVEAQQQRVDESAHHGPEGEVDAEASERSEEHTSELQSLMRISYAVFCLKNKKNKRKHIKKHK